jgi:WD40 repeat protein
MIEGHSAWVNSVAFSHNGKLIVSGLYDKTLTLDTSLDSLEQLHGLFVLNNWVVGRSGIFLWLPPDYRATCLAVWNTIIVLGHSSGKISFLEFREGLRLIQKQYTS